jgi:hypothetical protein
MVPWTIRNDMSKIKQQPLATVACATTNEAERPSETLH